MAKEDILEFPGVVKELLPNATFKVELDNGLGLLPRHTGAIGAGQLGLLRCFINIWRTNSIGHNADLRQKFFPTRAA